LTSERASDRTSEAAALEGRLDRALAQHYAPPCIVVNDALEVLQTRGDTRRYLQGEELDPTWRAAVRTLIARAESGPARDAGVLAIPLDGAYAITFESREPQHEAQPPEPSPANQDLLDVFSTVNIPLVILDKHARIRRFTAAARRLFNAADSDVGRALSELALNIELDDLEAIVAHVIDRGEPWESEVRDRDGCWHRVHVRPYRGPQRSVEGVMISLVDIDALKHSLREAELANEQAEQANRSKDEFLATLSHELRSPLHSMLVYAQLLQRTGLDRERAQRATEAIESGVLLLVQLIDELLDVSRIMNGKFRLNLEPVDLVMVTKRVLESVADKCSRKSLRVSATLPPTLRVSGDVLRLQQVVANLLSNAIKFTPNHGAINVSLRRVDERAVLSVRDDGVGIEPSFLPHVFERFTQGNSSLTREFGGLGLGLNIVSHIVELHRGDVVATSEGAGQGAVFTVSLPLIGEQLLSEKRIVRPPTSTPLLHGLRVLLVDDDHQARQAVCDMLSHAGAEVLSAPSAADAMEALIECAPELMVCDIAMPGEDGFSLMRRVRALDDARLAKIPAVALTAFARASDRERALEAGYQQHLAKPVDIDVLTQALAALRADSSAP
jgi:two-component system CheB/CheR fusion protein